ncbi:MAG TPA: RNA polymerase subunit sigma-24, partial [Blastocatellia bacterium]|nr:RNA polymerase subunit sigma-24 [Blastocatellia bacterium]
MLNIYDGESTGGTAKEFGLPGEHFAFNEALVEGPTPAGLSPDAWIDVRARFLSGAYGPRLGRVRKALAQQEDALRSYPNHEEVILWFDNELFCQVNLIYLLDWFARQTLGRTKLSLICIGEFPGKPDFHGLGELRGDQLATLLDARQQITRAKLELGSKAWQAYCSADPLELTRLLEQNTSALPYLNECLVAHLMRFPSVRNGLGHVENRALEFIAAGAKTFSPLFLQFRDQDPKYGFGDLQLWSCLWRLIAASKPLISVGDLKANNAPTKRRRFGSAEFEITE